MKLGEILIQNGFISTDQLQTALDVQAGQPDKKVGEILIELGFLTDEQLKKALDNQ